MDTEGNQSDSKRKLCCVAGPETAPVRRHASSSSWAPPLSSSQTVINSTIQPTVLHPFAYTTSSYHKRRVSASPTWCQMQEDEPSDSGKAAATDASASRIYSASPLGVALTKAASSTSSGTSSDRIYSPLPLHTWDLSHAFEPIPIDYSILQSRRDEIGSSVYRSSTQLTSRRGKNSAIPRKYCVSNQSLVLTTDLCPTGATSFSTEKTIKAQDVCQSVDDVKRSSLTLPALLSLPSDADGGKMSAHQVFLRRQIEVFAATIDDVQELYGRGRNHKRILVNQVGIRCRHCAHLSVAKRRQGAVYFPTHTMGLYQAAQKLNATHYFQYGLCPEMPDDVQQHFIDLLPTKFVKSRVGRKYWSGSAVKSFGLVNTNDGIYLYKGSSVA